MGCCASIPQGSVGMVERCGKFQRQATPGLQLLCCILGEHVSGHVSLRVQSLDVQVETKTKDNVFLHVKVSVQYQVEPDSVFDAYYRLSEPHAQITTYVYDGAYLLLLYIIYSFLYPHIILFVVLHNCTLLLILLPINNYYSCAFECAEDRSR